MRQRRGHIRQHGRDKETGGNIIVVVTRVRNHARGKHHIREKIRVGSMCCEKLPQSSLKLGGVIPRVARGGGY